jgi:ribonucleotide reductase beta subunit family protein with ferritin-like domain
MTETANQLLPYKIPVWAVYTLRFKQNHNWIEIEVQVRRDRKVIETLRHAEKKAAKMYPNKNFEFVRLIESSETVIFYL